MNRTTKYIFQERQRGVSLPVALILLIPLTLLGVTLANRNNLEEMMAGSQRDGQQSLMNAESGLAIGQQVLEKMVVDQVAAEKAGDTVGLTINKILDKNNYAGAVPYDGKTLTNYPLTKGTVTVVVLDNDDGDGDPTVDVDDQIILRSTGDFQSGERVVEAVVALTYIATSGPLNRPPLTIFTEEWLKLNGNPDFYGPNSLVHSNAYVEIGGVTRISGEIQQVSSDPGDNYSQAVDGVWGDWADASVTTGASRIETPYVYPPVYKGMATYYMTADCEIWDGVEGYTSLLTGVASKQVESNAKDNEWNGWKCDYSGDKNKKWELLGDKSISGFYYVEGNLIISGDMGEELSPLKISIVAEGYMDISGNPFIEPYNPQGDFTTAPSVQALAQIVLDGNPVYNGVNALDAVLKSDEILLLAGGDLNIQGNPASNFSFQGVMAAHDHFTISGNPKMQGAVIAENSKYTDSSFFFGNIDSGERKADMLTINEISGEPDIFGQSNLGGSGGASVGDPIGANLKGWREAIE